MTTSSYVIQRDPVAKQPKHHMYYLSVILKNPVTTGRTMHTWPSQPITAPQCAVKPRGRDSIIVPPSSVTQCGLGLFWLMNPWSSHLPLIWWGFLCKYLLTCKVSRYCILVLHGWRGRWSSECSVSMECTVLSIKSFRLYGISCNQLSIILVLPKGTSKKPCSFQRVQPTFCQ